MRLGLGAMGVAAVEVGDVEVEDTVVVDTEEVAEVVAAATVRIISCPISFGCDSSILLKS